MLAPRYRRGSSAAVAVTCSIALLIAALIGSIDRLARLRLSTLRTPSRSNLVVEFVGRHQRSPGGSVGLARDHARAGFSGDAPVAEIAGYHSLTNEGEYGG